MAQYDLLPIPFTGSPYVMLGKQEYFCHQGRDYNKGKKDKYIEKKKVASKQDHVFIKSRNHTQPLKKLGCPMKFCVKKITGLHPARLVLTPKTIEKKLIEI